MSKNFTEKELEFLLRNNPKIKVAKIDSTSNKIVLNKEKNKLYKISLIDEPVTKKKSNSLTIYNLNKTNKEATYECSTSDEHFSILFKGARLLSINEIFAKLQIPKSKFEVFNYKKNWHNIISKILYEQSIISKLPYFDCPVEITVFRQAPRLVDKDAVSIMFKFIIDALKRNKENPYGIIAEDNPQIVNNIIPQSEKGEYYVGIKIKKTLVKSDVFLPSQILMK